MKHLIIIGARGFGREIFFHAQNSLGYQTEFIIKGFLDDGSDVLDGYSGYPPILGPVEDYRVEKDDVFICALGDVHYKKKYCEIIQGKGGEFITLQHKNATVYSTAKIGKGCLICQGVTVSADVEIGDFVVLQPMVLLGHDTKIGKWSHLNTGAICCGFVSVGELSTLHTGAIVTPKLKIGNRSIVGVGSTVIKNVEDDVTVFGNPAITVF
jgi:sugar O-acyltransferase (sialic acid O-acetyltransferase NeuD family)